MTLEEADSPTHLRRNWIITTGTSLLTGLIVFIAAPVAANRLGPAGRGTLVTVQLLPQILADLSSLGLGFSIVHFGAQERRSVRVLWKWSLSRCALGTALLFSLGQLAAPLVTSTPGDERMLRIYLFICPITAFITVPLEMLRALGRFRSWNAFTFLIQAVWPAALLIGVLQPTPSLWLVVWLHLGAISIVLATLIVVVAKVTAGSDAPPRTERSEFLRYGLKSALSTIPSSANAKLDQLVMAAFVAKSDLGLYAAAAGWSQLTLPVMRGLIAISMPFVSGSSDDDRSNRVQRLTTLGALTVFVLSIGGILATLVLWGPLYGAAYKPALFAALILMVATLLLQYNALLSNLLRSLNAPGLVTGIESGVLVLSTIALVVALHINPVNGAAIVSLLTYTLAGIVYGRSIARRIGEPLSHLFDRAGTVVLMKQITSRFTRKSA